MYSSVSYAWLLNLWNFLQGFSVYVPKIDEQSLWNIAWIVHEKDLFFMLQLRYYCGLGTSDLRLTLPNLKSLLELRLGVKL